MRILSVGSLSGISTPCVHRNWALNKVAEKVDEVNTQAYPMSLLAKVAYHLWLWGQNVPLPENNDENKKIRALVDANHYDVVWIDKGQIRYVISKCRMFIGGRTHSVISAYSTGTPAIALGYSIKSKGIAKDVGMPKETVVDSKHIKQGQLLNAYLSVTQDIESLKKILNENMKTYKARVWGTCKIIDGIIS